jgi:hypothetical protein
MFGYSRIEGGQGNNEALVLLEGPQGEHEPEELSLISDLFLREPRCDSSRQDRCDQVQRPHALAGSLSPHGVRPNTALMSANVYQDGDRLGR